MGWMEDLRIPLRVLKFRSRPTDIGTQEGRNEGRLNLEGRLCDVCEYDSLVSIDT